MPPSTRTAVLDQPAKSQEWFYGDYIWVNLPDPETPETLLLRALEEGEAGSALALVPDVAHLDAMIAKLPLVEQDIVHLVHAGKYQWEIAEILGVTQCAISHRLHRAAQRLRWIAGPGSLFTSEDMVRDEAILLHALEPQQVEYLRVFWETTSFARTGERLGHRHTKHTHLKVMTAYRRLMASTDPALTIYQDGFTQLLDWGLGLLTLHGVQPFGMSGPRRRKRS